MAYSLLALSGIVAVLMVYLNTREHAGIGIKDYFIVFFMIMYGPQICFVPGFDETISPLISPEIHQQYLVGMAIAYYSVAFGWLGAHVLGSQTSPATLGGAGGHIGGVPTPFVAAPYLAIAWVVVVAAVEGFSFEKLTTIASYASGTGDLAYVEIRNELFDDRAVDALSRLTRYNITAFLFCMSIGAYVITRRRLALTVVACLLLFLVCAIEIKKFIWVYYLLLATLTTYHVLTELRGKSPLSARALVLAAIGMIVLLGFILVSLYFFQYRSQAEEGDFELFDALYVSVYRIFLVYQDVLLLYFFVYPSSLPHLDGSGIQLLMTILGGEFRDATVEVPVIALNARQTSFPAGFVASGYADFGLPGIAASGIFVGGLVVFLSRVVRRISDPVTRGVFTAMVGLSVNQFTATPLHTALLSGGILSGPIIIWLYLFLQPRQQPEHVWQDGRGPQVDATRLG